MDKTVNNCDLYNYNQFVINVDIILIDVNIKKDVITPQFINNINHIDNDGNNIENVLHGI